MVQKVTKNPNPSQSWLLKIHPAKDARNIRALFGAQRYGFKSFLNAKTERSCSFYPRWHLGKRRIMEPENGEIMIFEVPDVRFSGCRISDFSCTLVSSYACSFFARDVDTSAPLKPLHLWKRNPWPMSLTLLPRPHDGGMHIGLQKIKYRFWSEKTFLAPLQLQLIGSSKPRQWWTLSGYYSLSSLTTTTSVKFS